MYRKALGMPNVSFLWNTRAERLVVENEKVVGVEVSNLRSGAVSTLRAPNVVLATGGFESDLERVRANWMKGMAQPERLLVGSAISATGSGHDMATDAGAALQRIDRHYIYINGVPDPRDERKTRALTAGNDVSMWVNAEGRRFTNESGFDKDILVDLLQQTPASYWVIFDSGSRDEFAARGAAWLNNPGDEHSILDNPQVVQRADSIGALAELAGLPGDALIASVNRFNALIESGEDTEFARFASGEGVPPRIERAPFYAVQMFPMTRKNMGGVAIDTKAHALDFRGQSIPGLYAIGELTGSVGINGKHGLDGMFLGPAILTGRLAGQSIADSLPLAPAPPAAAPVLRSHDAEAWRSTLTGDDLKVLVSTSRNGYWHFQVSHGLVLERGYSCDTCHSASLPFAAPGDRAGSVAQTEVCTNCHCAQLH
jgi:succinate dehydrogenase/fumarate reductase flavoprotein subunit